MTLEQLFGKYMRLREELSEACRAPVQQDRHIDRLADEMAIVQREITGFSPLDEQTAEPLFGI